MNLRDRAEKWLQEHEHYPHDPSYEQDVTDLQELLLEFETRAWEAGWLRGRSLEPKETEQ